MKTYPFFLPVVLCCRNDTFGEFLLSLPETVLPQTKLKSVFEIEERDSEVKSPEFREKQALWVNDQMVRFGSRSFAYQNRMKGFLESKFEDLWVKIDKESIYDGKKYASNSELLLLFQQMSEKCSDIMSFHSLGFSTEGREMPALIISEDPLIYDRNTITIALMANMHGNEATGREILLRFAESICSSYLSEEDLTVLDDLRIIIAPTLNPIPGESLPDVSERRGH